MRGRERPIQRCRWSFVAAFPAVLSVSAFWSSALPPAVDISFSESRRGFKCQTTLPARCFSTRRDVIFTMAVLEDRWFDITLLSIRTCGCGARIVLYTILEQVFTPHYGRVIAMTNAEVVHRDVPRGASTVDMIRHPWLQHFLLGSIGSVDRIFMVDAHDVFFHRDPFEVLNFTDSMAFFVEGCPIGRAGMNAGWMKHCFGEAALAEVRDNDTICAGTIYGDAKSFIRFLDVILNRMYGTQHNCAIDQPIVNWVVYHGDLQRAGVKFRLMPCNGPVLTLSNCPRTIRRVGEIEEGFNSDGVIPHVVHQWKSFIPWKWMYVRRCNMTVYIRTLEARTGQDLNWTEPVRHMI
jgi:hypothetical protein